MLNSIKWLGILVGALMAVSCIVSPTNRASAVQVTVKEQVAQCKFLGGVYAEVAIPYLAAGQEQAKNQALDEAAFLQATHVVWTQAESGWRPYAAGRAYRCQDELKK